MNRLYITIAAMMAISGTQLFADYTVKNSADADAEVYLIGKSYENISKGSKGNMAYDFQGKLEGNPTRFVPAGQDTTYSWDDGDARSGLPIDAVMVRFKQASGGYPADFSKSVQENGIAATNNQTAILTKNSSGKPSIKYVDGGPLKPDTGGDVQSVAADLIQARKDAAKQKLKGSSGSTLFP